MVKILKTLLFQFGLLHFIYEFLQSRLVDVDMTRERNKIKRVQLKKLVFKSTSMVLSL